MQFIYLTNGHEIQVSDEDFEILNDISWHVTETGYVRNVEQKVRHRGQRMSRMVAIRMDLNIFAQHVKYLDGDKINVQRENLYLKM